jgi:hypothetical protein
MSKKKPKNPPTPPAPPEPPSPFPLSIEERSILFSNVFKGTFIPDTSAVFFDTKPTDKREEIKSADISVRGSDRPWQVIYGKVLVGGVLIFVTTDVPGGGEYLHVVHAVAGHECNALLGLVSDGQDVPFGTSGGNIYGWSTGAWATTGGLGYYNVSFSEGELDQPANADLVSQSALLFPGIWTSDHRCRGIAHVYNIIYFHPSKFPSGSFPELQFLIEGKNDIYDPRTATTGYTNNAALCIANYLTDTRIGRGVDSADIDWDNFEEAADIADEDVDVAGGGTEKRYTMNGVFDTSEDPQTILQKMQSTIGGPIVFQGGKWRCYPGAWRTPTISLGAGDIIGDLSFSLQPSRRDLFNGVKGTYMNPDSWEIEDFPAVTNSTYETEDDEQLLFDVTYPLTTSISTVQRLSKMRLERARQCIEVEGTFTLKAFQAQVGDNIQLTFSGLSWVAKEFEVQQIQLVLKNETVAVQMTLKETASGVFDWSDGEETTVDLAPNTTLPDPSVVNQPTGLTLESGTKILYTRLDGSVFSRIKVSWDAVVDPFVKNGGAIEIRAKNDTAGEEYSAVGTYPGTESFAYILDVKDGNTYSVGVRFKNGLENFSDWTTDDHLVLGKSAPPSIVSSLTGTPNEVGIALSWPAISDPDFSHYSLGYGDDRANRLTYSEQLNQTAWVKTSCTTSTDAAVAPDGTTSAEKIVEAAATAEHHIEQIGVTISSGSQYRAIAHVKRAGRTKVRVALSAGGFGTAPSVDVDLLTGAQIATTGSPTSIEIKEYDSEWYRISFLATATSDNGNGGMRIYPLNDSAASNYLGDITKGVYAWGCAVNLASESSKYIKTTSSIAVAGVRTVIASEISTTNYTWQIQSAGSYELNIMAVDTSGNESLAYTKSTVTVAAPSAPLNLIGTISGPDMLLSWDAPTSTQFTVEQYEIREGATVLNRVKGTLFRQRVTWVGAKTFSVFAIDIKQNISVQTDVTVTIVAPNAPTNLRPVVVDNNVLLYFDEPTTHTLPIDYYIVRRAGDVDKQTSRPFINIFEVLGGMYTYEAFAVDTAGNEGASSTVDTNVNQPPDFILRDQGTIDPDDYNTFTNAVVAEDGTSFYAPIITGETVQQWFDNNGYNTIQDFIDAGYDAFLTPSNAASNGVVEEKIDLGLLVPSSIITCSISEAVLGGSGMVLTPTISYSPDDVTYTSGGAGNSTVFASIAFRYIKFKYEIDAPDGMTLSKFSAHNYTVQVKKQTDSGIKEITSNPTAFDFNLDFLDIESIVGTAQGTTALIVVIDFTDAPNPTGGNIYLFDAAGASAAGAGKYVRWVAEGAVSPN